LGVWISQWRRLSGVDGGQNCRAERNRYQVPRPDPYRPRKHDDGGTAGSAERPDYRGHHAHPGPTRKAGIHRTCARQRSKQGSDSFSTDCNSFEKPQSSSESRRGVTILAGCSQLRRGTHRQVRGVRMAEKSPCRTNGFPVSTAQLKKTADGSAAHSQIPGDL
jgi:hypothetical protein